MTASCPTAQQRINECQGLVRSLASEIRRKLPPHVELDDLIAYGQVGLAQAARDFDPSRGSRFSTYAYYRVRGAIYDGLAKMSWFTRTQYHQVRYERAANEVLQADGQSRHPSHRGGPEDDLCWFRDLSRALGVVYLSTRRSESEEAAAEELADHSSADPSREALEREISQKLHEAVEALPDEARTLVRLTFFEGLSLQAAADRLNISKSWASRLLRRTLGQLGRWLSLSGVAN